MRAKRVRKFLDHAHFIKTTPILLPRRAATWLQTALPSGEWFYNLFRTWPMLPTSQLCKSLYKHISSTAFYIATVTIWGGCNSRNPPPLDPPLNIRILLCYHNIITTTLVTNTTYCDCSNPSLYVLQWGFKIIFIPIKLNKTILDQWWWCGQELEWACPCVFLGFGGSYQEGISSGFSVLLASTVSCKPHTQE